MSANNELPHMANFIQQLTRQAAVLLYDVKMDNCTICSDRLVEDENSSVKHMLPCGHLFHNGCVIQSLQSNSPGRNHCPNCRTYLRKLNILTPEQLASIAAENNTQNEEMTDFNAKACARIVTITNQYFDWQWTHYRPEGCEDYIRIVGEVRKRWCEDGQANTRVCHDHVRMEWDWFEYTWLPRPSPRPSLLV
jgi:hypothetical protein